jgi:hypothetical protein
MGSVRSANSDRAQRGPETGCAQSAPAEPISGLAAGAGPPPGGAQEEVLAEQDAGEKDAGGG